MKLFNWKRPLFIPEEILFEELEQRVVLDASTDAACECADTDGGALASCPCLKHLPQPKPDSTEGGPSEAYQAMIDDLVSKLYGLLHADSDQGDFYGRLHADDDSVYHLLGGGADVDHTRQVQIVSSLSGDHTVYLKFYDFGQGCQKWGAGGQYTPADFPGWTPVTGDCNLLSHDLTSGNPLTLNFDKPDQGQVAITLSVDTTTGCSLSQAEMTLHNLFGGQWHDGYDISLVNGFNVPVKIDAPYATENDPYTPGNPIRCLPTIQATAQLGNSTNPGVFGLGNDQCCASCMPPSDCCSEWGDKIAAEAHPTYQNVTPNCPGTDPWAPCPNADPQPVHSGSARCDARPRCQMDGWQSQATTNVFTVTFG